MDLSDVLPLDAQVQFQGEVALPGTKYDVNTNSVGLTVRHSKRASCMSTRACLTQACLCALQGPIDVKFHNVSATVTI